MQMKVVLFILMLLGGYAISHAQLDAKDLLRGYIENMSKVSNPEDGKVYYIHMLVNNVYKQETHAIKKVEFKAYMTADQMVVNSNVMQAFGDTADVFTIIPATRQIIQQNGIVIGGNALQRNRLLNMQQDLVENCQVVEQKMLPNEVVMLKLKPAESIAENKKIESLVLYYCQNKAQITKVCIFYDKHSLVKAQEIDYKALDFDASMVLDSTPMVQRILDINGELKEPYRSYTLINQKQ